MKILLIFTLSLISGPVGCVDVIGYSGGSIILISNVYSSSAKSNYICKVENRECTDIIRLNTGKNDFQVERFMLYKNTEGFLTAFIRKLKPQDAGMYRMGAGTQRYTDVTLKVVNDSCCAGPKIMNAYRGQNTSIICNYPVVYERDYKYIQKLDNDSVIRAILDPGSKSQNSRFSFSDDRSAKVLSVSIIDVREADDGVYLCGVYNTEVQYFSYFTEIQLHVRALTDIPSDVVDLSSSVIIISVCVCVALLLIGGFALMVYKLRHKRTQSSGASSQDNEQAPSVYENDLANLPPYENLNFTMRLNHQKLDSFTSQSDSTYQTLDPLTNQSDSGYASLTNTTDQSHSHYQCLNTRTQTNSIYHTLHS
ncbi:uncharacterized protein LOC113530856 isoform X1 [Pangasianodon hypophthalmus]|uniref:uncharacterized protein LOC113530856 isoform X1 n=1 Tax=Pangasianodon hypophthalmus TaxID=310915 RepID=UPI002307CC8B|nr:uncharacterized protein LOC113530856 isoform X1 [Pangasianodon hypophthalmus]